MEIILEKNDDGNNKVIHLSQDTKDFFSDVIIKDIQTEKTLTFLSCIYLILDSEHYRNNKTIEELEKLTINDIKKLLYLYEYEAYKKI